MERIHVYIILCICHYSHMKILTPVQTSIVIRVDNTLILYKLMQISTNCFAFFLSSSTASELMQSKGCCTWNVKVLERWDVKM